MNAKLAAAVVSAGFLWSSVTHAQSQDLASKREALKDIRETAADICYTVEQRGRKSDTQLSGEVQAKVAGTFAKLVDLGLKGSGQIGSSEYEGVSQDALGTALTESAHCRENVFNKLVDRMLPYEPSGSKSTSSSVAGTYQGKTYLVLQAGGSRQQFANDVSITVDPIVNPRSISGTLINEKGTFPLQGSINGNSIFLAADFASMGGPDIQMAFKGVVTNGNSIKGEYQMSGKGWDAYISRLSNQYRSAGFSGIGPNTFEVSK